MMNLFGASARAPLAERMRPVTLDEVIGQQHLIGPGKPLRRAIESGYLPSLIFWGPPGVGKTTLSQMIAGILKKPFHMLSAVQSGVKEVREAIEQARHYPGTILFIDEIHRFNKSQQDALLGAVEKGTITLIGATTENPSFEVNGALLSRCQVYVLQALSQDEIREVVVRALRTDPELSARGIELKEWEAIYRISAGDARKALNILEIVAGQTEGGFVITDDLVATVIQKNLALYDKSGEQHYDIISAFIKSVRGSDPNAAVYWLARMLEGGEDILFIARRMIILASEDIGNANPNALLLANACFQSCHQIGMPEARIILSQTATYLATSAKSNAAYAAIDAALQVVRNGGDYPVPLHLRNAPTKMMKGLGYGEGYKYSHSFTGREANQEFLPEKLSGTVFYAPKSIGREAEIRRFMQDQWGDKYTPDQD